jgi:hypothetical protein
LRRLPAGQNVVPLHVSPTRWAFDVYDTATQAMSSNYVEVAGGRGEYITIPFRYVWPAELDLMAQLAGLRLRERWDGWTREPFTSESRQHVSIWRSPPANRDWVFRSSRDEVCPGVTYLPGRVRGRRQAWPLRRST